MKSMMKKMILALSILGLVAIVAPRPASANVSLFFGLPGVSLFAGPPVYAPPVYGPPVVYAPRRRTTTATVVHFPRTTAVPTTTDADIRTAGTTGTAGDNDRLTLYSASRSL